jgi:predicted DsbA family dithiol-disulfide isomerase
MIQRAQEGWDGPQIDVRWRAFQLAPDNPPRGRPFREVIEDKLGGPAGYAQMSARLAAIGAEVGIPFAIDRIGVSPNTRLAHRVIAQARLSGDPDAVVEALFTGYFCEGVDITDPDEIVALLRAHGADPHPEQLVATAQVGEADALVEEDLAIGARIGASAVPLLIADGTRGIVGAQPPEAIRRLVLGTEAAS